MTHSILRNYTLAFVALSLSCLNIACPDETDTKKPDTTEPQDDLGLELDQLRLIEAEDNNAQTDIFSSRERFTMQLGFFDVSSSRERCTMHFGTPVVPEEYIIYKGWANDP